MNAQNFCYWLQGFNEVADKAPNQREWQIILDHLKIVDELQIKNPPLFGIGHSPLLNGDSSISIC
jgi:hypothetical protein